MSSKKVPKKKKKMKYLKSLTQMHHRNHDEPSTTLN